MLLGFGDPLRSSPLICRSRTSERVTTWFWFTTVSSRLSDLQAFVRETAECDHHCHQCWYLRAGCCCTLQHSHNYFADLAWRSTLSINRKCVFPISKRCYICQTWVFVGPVEKRLSALCFSCNITHLSTFPHDIINWWKNIHSNYEWEKHHEWERHHSEGCRRRSRFLVKCEWHSMWYLTSVPGAISLSDRGRRLHESWFCTER